MERRVKTIINFRYTTSQRPQGPLSSSRVHDTYVPKIRLKHNSSCSTPLLIYTAYTVVYSANSFFLWPPLPERHFIRLDQLFRVSINGAKRHWRGLEWRKHEDVSSIRGPSSLAPWTGNGKERADPAVHASCVFACHGPLVFRLYCFNNIYLCRRWPSAENSFDRYSYSSYSSVPSLGTRIVVDFSLCVRTGGKLPRRPFGNDPNYLGDGYFFLCPISPTASISETGLPDCDSLYESCLYIFRARFALIF